MPFVERDNASIYYEVHGEGPPIVFAHGAGGNTLIWWQQVPYFARNHKVVNFDHRGWGRSKCDQENRKARYFADDMKAVLDAAGVEKTAVVCQSMGGWTGMHFTLANPDRVSCLVLSGTPGGVMTPRVAEARARRESQGSSARPATTPWNESHWALASDAFERNPGRAFLYAQMSSLNPPPGDSGTGEMGIEPERLKGYSIPTMMLGGENDRIFAPELLKDVAQIIPGATFHIIPKSGHSPYFEAPDEFNQLVGEFITKYWS
jgi:pimeloyl-ACP methyl ester carboxylesterase